MEGDQRTYRKGKAKYSMPTRDEDGGELLQLRRTVGEGLWCVVGDFNVIRCLERVGNNGGIQQRGREILEFNNFIENMELVELPSVGRKFSRIKEAGNAMSRLERALVLIKWLNLWPNATQYVLDRSISDHFPFLVNHINPFKVFNHWIEKPGFVDYVRQMFTSYDVRGWGAIILKEIKLLKKGIRKCCVEKLGGFQAIVDGNMARVNLLDGKEELGMITLDEQKSRIKWLKDGDLNTEFFHAMVYWRKRVNCIKGIEIRFLKKGRMVARLDRVHFKSILEEAKVSLEARFSKVELKCCMGIKGIKDTITLKTILRCFELVTGLKVNFSKSSLVSINVDQRDCLSCARILNCNTMSFPFTYLGLPVGADTRKISTWQPVIDKLKKKLAQWRRRHLSFGGRICLMRWVLSSIPFYFLSLFKIPRKVIIVINGIKKNSLES
ncbi:hypothetical protein GmHk_17G049420 [Glycine max]|nr:hypothetical protein GmHk_17G049420 [Glycine max]